MSGGIRSDLLSKDIKGQLIWAGNLALDAADADGGYVTVPITEADRSPQALTIGSNLVTVPYGGLYRVEVNAKTTSGVAAGNLTIGIFTDTTTIGTLTSVPVMSKLVAAATATSVVRHNFSGILSIRPNGKLGISVLSTGGNQTAAIVGGVRLYRLL